MNEHIDDLLPFYANATLPAEPREAAAAHLAVCAQCRKALREWEALAGMVRVATLPRSQVEAGLAEDIPALSPVVRANLRGKPSFPEAVLSVTGLIRAQWTFLKESALVQTVSAVFLAVVPAGLFLPAGDALLAAAPFLILVPLLAALGIGFLESRQDGPAAEIIAAAPTHPGVLTFARLTMALGFIAGLALVSSLLVSGLGEVSLIWLVLAWLGPMLWLSALTTLLSLLVHPWAAAGISATLWGAVSLLLVNEGHGSALLGFSLAPLLYPSWWSFGLQALLAGLLWLACWLWLYWGAPLALQMERSS